MAKTSLNKHDIGSGITRANMDAIRGNFDKLQKTVNDNDTIFIKHKTTEKNAHSADQVGVFGNYTVKDNLEWLEAIINRLVLGANGDGVEEIKQTRVGVFDNKGYDTSNSRLKADFLHVDNKLEKNKEEMRVFSRDKWLSDLRFKRTLTMNNSREPLGDTRYPQASVIIRELNRYFIYRQTSGEYSDQRMYEYDLATQELITSKSMDFIPTRVYMEGMLWKHEEGNLKFVVPLGYYGGAYGIYNYTKNKLESTFYLEGNNKFGFDPERKYAIFTSSEIIDGQIASPFAASNGFNIYDYDSVFSGNPILVKEVRIPHFLLSVPDKIQSVTLIHDMIVCVQGSTDTILKVYNQEGLLLYTEAADRADYIEQLFGVLGTDSTVESESVNWVESEDGEVHLVVGTAAVSKFALIEYGASFDDDDRKEVKTKLVKSNSFWNSPYSNSAFRMMNASGSPFIALTKSTDDFKATVENLEQAGMYTCVVSNVASGFSDYLTTTLTGFVYVRSTTQTVVATENNEVTTTKANRAIYELWDTAGRKISGTMDKNRDEVWSEPVLDGNYAAKIPSSLTKLESFSIPGKYLITAEQSRKITDLPSSYSTGATYLEVIKVDANNILHQVKNLNSSSGDLADAERFILSGHAVIGTSTDNKGYRYKTFSK